MVARATVQLATFAFGDDFKNASADATGKRQSPMYKRRAVEMHPLRLPSAPSELIGDGAVDGAWSPRIGVDVSAGIRVESGKVAAAGDVLVFVVLLIR